MFHSLSYVKRLKHKTPFVIDRTTSTQFQKGVQSTVNFGVQQGTNRLNND